jgi:hypothetical protein
MILCGVALANATQSSDSAAASTPDTNVKELTGEDVGQALGLKPITDNVVEGCDRLVQYAEHGAFCLDGVTQDPKEEDLLALQVQGYERTPTAVAYVEALRAFEAVEDLSSNEALDLNAAAQKLYGQLQEEQPEVG